VADAKGNQHREQEGTAVPRRTALEGRKAEVRTESPGRRHNVADSRSGRRASFIHERGGAEKSKRREGNIKPSRAIRNVANTHSFRGEKIGGRNQSDEKKSGCGGDHEGRGGGNA